MGIFLNILFLIIGMFLLIKGADYFVSGASAVAKKLKIPAMFIGLTIVAIGTSLPELSVSITSAIKQDVELSISNVTGSNMCNMLLILGCVATFSKVKLSASTKKIDFPFLIAITSALTLFTCDIFIDGANGNLLSRTDSIVLIVLLVLYFCILISNARKERRQMLENSFELTVPENLETEESKPKNLKVWQILLYIVLGLAAVVFGGECVSTTAKYLAIQAGMSETLVGLTIVAIGTSLPELVTSVVAAKKGENDLALGNVIGSSIINIALILGMVGTITPILISTTILTDLFILLGSTLFFAIVCAKKTQIGKKEGFVFIVMYVLYITFAIIRNYCF
ncbi:MAG: calcium/sodium antiporter [Clostridia bacterium]|nr:calcium/sodium antiporter [Clostridia bacterium]